ncbi:MAG TPA: hypothetical protein VML75_17785 [Kofleriaceae bacterium]|nr:hypothetical protein [Kofleriaceae bacterium]
MSSELAAFETTEDAGRSLPAYGPDWEAAIAAGVDVTLIEANLSLPPYERLRRHFEHARFRERVQARTVPPALRAEIEARRFAEKLASLGIEGSTVIPDLHVSSDGDG